MASIHELFLHIFEQYKNHTVTHIFIDLSRNFYTNERTWKFLGKSHQRVHAGYNGSRSCDTFGRGAVSSLLCFI